MKIDQLPQELWNKTVIMSDFSPLTLLRLGKGLTHRDNGLSEAALDKPAWKQWSRSSLSAQTPHLSLSEAFKKRWSQKDSVDKKALRELYEMFEQGPSAANLQSFFMSPDLDVQIAMFEIAVADGYYLDLSRRVSLDVLCEPRIAIQLLSDPAWLAEALPHTIIALQKCCTEERMPIPALSMSDSIWAKFSPETDLLTAAHHSLFELARARWDKKGEHELKAVASASETYRLRKQEASSPLPKTADFDLMLALCASQGSNIQYAQTSLLDDKGLALLAMKNDGGEWFEFLSFRLRDDDDVAKLAVVRWGEALEFTSERLRADVGIVRLACLNWAGNIRHAAEAVLQDVDIVLSIFDLVGEKAVFYANLPPALKHVEQIQAVLTHYLKGLTQDRSMVNSSEFVDFMRNPERVLVQQLGVPVEAVSSMLHAIERDD